MPKLGTEEQQHAVVDSIFEDSAIVGDWRNDPLPDERVEQQEETPEPDTQQGEGGADAEAFVEQEAARRAGAEFPGEQQERQEQQTAEQQTPPQEITPGQARENIQSREAFVQEHQLIDPVSTKEFALSMGEAFGTGIPNFNEQFGLTSVLVTHSAAEAHDALGPQFEQFAADVFRGNAGPIVPPAMANEFTSRFLRSCNQDPRLWEGKVDKQLFADTAFFCDANIIHTIRNNSGVTDPSQINKDVDVCVWAYSRLLRAFGIDVEAEHAKNPDQFIANALTLADARARYVLSFLGKLGQIQPAQQSKPGKRETSRFKTNSDLYSEDVLEQLALEKVGRKQSDTKGVRTPKKQTFQSNADIFDEGLEAYRQVEGSL